MRGPLLPEDLDTLRAGRDLVEALYLQGFPTDAARLQDQLVEAFTSVLGADDLETITSLAYQATLLRDAGQYARARAIEEQVVEATSRVLGPEHPDTLRARVNLAGIINAQGNKSQASSLLAESLGISLRIHGKQHSSSSEIAWQLAESCGPHEANKRRAIIMENLSWLSTQRSDHLTAQQKKIKNALKGSIHGGKKGGHKPKKRRK